jgi:signal transduction histidine kinase
VIIINSPFWRTIPFYLAVVILLILGGYLGASYWLNRKLLVQKRELDTILKTQESERKRLAQDLHDDLGGSLSILRGRLSNEGVSHEMIQLVNQAIQDLRLISWNLLPPDLMKDGLIPALENAVERIQKSTDIKFTFIHFGKEKYLPEESRIHIYRIVLEVFNNILKHSKANEATMQLLFHEQMIYLSIEDNGIGINKEDSSWGIGFKNIQTRVDNLHAHWHIDTSNLGTTFILEIPYE